MSYDSITLSPNFLIYKVVLTATIPESDKASPSSLTPPETALELFTAQPGGKSTSNTQNNFLKLSQDQLSLYPLLRSTSPPPSFKDIFFLLRFLGPLLCRSL